MAAVIWEVIWEVLKFWIGDRCIEIYFAGGVHAAVGRAYVLACVPDLVTYIVRQKLY